MNTARQMVQTRVDCALALRRVAKEYRRSIAEFSDDPIWQQANERKARQLFTDARWWLNEARYWRSKDRETSDA